MFTYFKSAFKNAKPQLLITLIYALIAFAVIAVVYLLANFQLAKYVQTIAIYSQFGQKPPVDAYLKVIAVLLIAAVVSLFVLVQILGLLLFFFFDSSCASLTELRYFEE
ncbi:hypothetical protein Q0L85_13045, partial [Staphylococcus aureus]|nr:hypothetical protein [Staphylococcus aureus]